MSKENTFVSLAIDKNCTIANGKSYVLKIPVDKLSNEEHQVWLKFSMRMYDPNFETELQQEDELSVYGKLFYSCKFAIGRGEGRFKDYIECTS